MLFVLRNLFEGGGLPYCFCCCENQFARNQDAGEPAAFIVLVSVVTIQADWPQSECTDGLVPFLLFLLVILVLLML